MKPTKQPDQTISPLSIEPSEGAKSVSKNRNLLKGLLVILLLVGVGVSVFYWQQQSVDRLNKTNQDLTSQLLSAEADLPAPVTTQESHAAYTASVGKFTLTLPKEYVVIQNIDGAGEGGPSTSVQIGDKTAKSNVVHNAHSDAVTITSHELHGTFRELVDGELKDESSVKQASVRIDGVDAEVYLVGGLGAPKNIYFTKNNLIYKIYLSDTTAAANKKLDALLSGFKFN